mmetsp:Transcript_31693/g.49607  ORF Transcript_31693/g.49607 Transcript_31693/m.49607 type:complete len:315 (+) Transcript_31693:226-1170(+)
MATLQPFITVKGKRKPPSRLEGGGFMIKDIMAGVSFQELDPFLIWHELPEKHHRKGEMPGAPMHCHRGFIEAPYCKKFIGENGPNPDVDVMFAKDHTGQEFNMHQGDFEMGLVGHGLEHEGLVHPQWAGTLHFFQLWINLPKQHKFAAPAITNAEADAMPVVQLASAPKATAKLLIGELHGVKSPVETDLVEAQYFDIEVAANGQVAFDPPLAMTSRFIWVYSGSIMIEGSECQAGEFVILNPGYKLSTKAGSSGAGFLWIAGKPIGEPVVQHGPFVMNTKEEIRQCFLDYQAGTLTAKPLKRRVIRAGEHCRT